MRRAGKKVQITAAGSGIGQAMAVLFARPPG
jgi:NAD(P)-dependent dehydrogenase (short-subunit alcohol dehydrogenase family)